jgi:hypothetical protein
MMTSMEDDLKNKNGRLPQQKEEDDLKKMEENLKKRKWKTNQSTKINLIGCDTIVNSPSSIQYGPTFENVIWEFIQGEAKKSTHFGFGFLFGCETHIV